jgi:hypothetical protein
LIRAREVSRTKIPSEQLSGLLKENSTLLLPFARAGLSIDTAHALKVTRRESTAGMAIAVAAEGIRFGLDVEQAHCLRPDAIPFGPSTGGMHNELVLAEPAGPKEATEQQAWNAFMDTLLARSSQTGEQPAKAVQAFQEKMTAAGAGD